jgi:hypothetical protein
VEFGQTLAAAGSLTCSSNFRIQVQILHLAPVELPGPAVRRLARSPHVAQLAALDPRLPSCIARSKKMLWAICLILLVLWALEMATSYTASGLIHILHQTCTKPATGQRIAT